VAAVLALIAALAYGAADFYGGLATRRLPAAAVVLRSNALALPCLVAGGAAVGGTWTDRDAVIGSLAGLAGTAGLSLLYRALAAGTMSVVAPITAVLAAVVPMTVGLVTGERPAPAALAGLPIALVAVVLLAGPPAPGKGGLAVAPAVLLAALGAGLGFGLFFVALDATSHQAGLWPVVASQATGIGLLLIAKVATSGAVSDPVDRRRYPWGLVVAAGLFSAAGHVSFLLATRLGLLSLVAVITSLYPASTLLLARVVLRERIGGVQRFGAVLALLAVVLISLP
jgi:uncharacterized membrane protein